MLNKTISGVIMAGTTDNNNGKKKQQRLGKGLNSLITKKISTAEPATAASSSDKEGRMTVPIDKIERDRKSTRLNSSHL